VPAWLRHPAVIAAGGFLAIRGFGLLALLLSPARDRPLIEVLGIWDGGWYVRIAESGYADHLDLSQPDSDQSTGSLAFFPVYPLLMRLLSAITGLDSRWAGVILSLAAGALAAAGIAALARDWRGDRVGVLAALLWACSPMAVVGALVYTEALFTALAVWTFVALRHDRWWLAAGLGFAAGLARPTGIAVGTAVAAWALWTYWHRRPRDRDVDSSWRAGVGVLLAGAVALAGTPTFWLWVGVRADRWDGWFAAQEAFWGSQFDGGAATLILVEDVILGDTRAGSELLSLAVVCALLTAVVLLILAIRGRVWWPLLVYGGVSLVMIIGGAGYFSSKLRFLVPLFVLAFPLARWLSARSRAIRTLVILAAVAGGTASGTWMLLSWPYAI